MAMEGVRRSRRDRKPVKRFAQEQAEEEEMAASGPQPKRRKQEAAAVELNKNSFDGIYVDDEAPATASKKRSTAPNASASKGYSGNNWHADAAERRIASSKKQIRRLAPGEEEIRLRDYVDEPTEEYRKFLQRANTDRMYVLNRKRGVEQGCHANHEDCPIERLQIAGSSGNVYNVVISHKPTCSCPVGIFTTKKREQCCKHVLYILHHVLKAPDELGYQNAFLTSELKALFANAPPMASEVPEEEPNDGNRKALSDDCPICFMDFEEGEETVWCRAACGNNVHAACFQQWANAKGNRVTCPFCRAPWQSGEAARKQKATVTHIEIPTERGKDGYLNVRHLLGYDV